MRALLLLVLFLLPAGCLAPTRGLPVAGAADSASSAAGPLGNGPLAPTSDPSASGFLLVLDLPARMQFVVPSGGPVKMELRLDQGAVTDLLLDGPGLCGGFTAPMGAYAPRVMEQRLEVDCGHVDPANYELSLSSTAGILRGSVRIFGGYFI